MWMDGIVLKTSIATDGANETPTQELRVSVEGDDVYVKCAGLFSLEFTLQEFDNLVDCVMTLRKLGDEE